MGEMHQGYYFGLMQGLFSVGTSGTGMIVGPLAEVEYDIPGLGVQRGWRIAFAIVSSFAIFASLLALSIMPEVPAPVLTEEQKQQPVGKMMGEEIQTMLKFLKYPSFVLMILQGIFGSIPWIVLGNLNLYARLCGFEKWTLFWLGFRNFWCGGWLLRWYGIRFPCLEDRLPGPPHDSHDDSGLRHSSGVHAVLRDRPRLSTQHSVGFLRNSVGLQFSRDLGTARLQFPSPWTDCGWEGPEQGDVLGDGI